MLTSEERKVLQWLEESDERFDGAPDTIKVRLAQRDLIRMVVLGNGALRFLPVE